jgi:hypothetical protein
MELFQWVLVAFSALLIFVTVYEYRRRRIGKSGLIGWALVWLLLLVSAINPPMFEFVVRFLQVEIPIHFVTICAIVLLFTLIYRLYTKIGELERSLTKLVQAVALRNVKDERKE